MSISGCMEDEWLHELNMLNGKIKLSPVKNDQLLQKLSFDIALQKMLRIDEQKNLKIVIRIHLQVLRL